MNDRLKPDKTKGMTNPKITPFLMCPATVADASGGTPAANDAGGGHIKKGPAIHTDGGQSNAARETRGGQGVVGGGHSGGLLGLGQEADELANRLNAGVRCLSCANLPERCEGHPGFAGQRLHIRVVHAQKAVPNDFG